MWWHSARSKAAIILVRPDTSVSCAGGPFFFASGVLYCVEFTGPNILKGGSAAYAAE